MVDGPQQGGAKLVNPHAHQALSLTLCPSMPRVIPHIRGNQKSFYIFCDASIARSSGVSRFHRKLLHGVPGAQVVNSNETANISRRG